MKSWARTCRRASAALTALLLLELMTATGAAAATATPSTTAPPITLHDGQFVRSSTGPEVYVMAGGSPVYVDSFAPFGHVPTITVVPHPTLFVSPVRPADGTFVATAGEGRVYRFVGGSPVYVDSWAPFGGPQPFTWIPSRAVSEAGRTGPWSTIRATPQDRSLIATAGEGRVYQMVDGAPVYVDSWDTVGGPRPLTWVTPGLIAGAGTADWPTLRRAPSDGFAVQEFLGQGRFVFVGGALLPDNGGSGVSHPVSAGLVSGAGSGPWANLRRYPTDGSFIATRGEGKVYQIVGGAPVYVPSWASVGGLKPYTWVDSEVLRTLDGRESFRLRSAPADGTLVATTGEGRVYQFIGGAPIYVDSWAGIGGFRPYTWVSPQAVASAGDGEWANLSSSPADGTVLTTTGDGRVHQIVGGAPIYLDSWQWVGGVRSATKVSSATVAEAGSGQWTNLNHSPQDGTAVRIDGRLHYFVGGAPVDARVPAWGNRIPEVGPTFGRELGTGAWANVRVTPRDGTFVLAHDGYAFRYAGGTPILIENWDGETGSAPYAVLDPAVLHAPDRPTPADGTFVSTTDGRVYRYAGGAPFYVTDWASVGGWHPATQVSAGAIDLAGTPQWPNLRRTPIDGTFVSTTDGTSYVMAGGAPIWIDSWQDWGGPRPTVTVSADVVSSPEQGAWANIRRTPVDGTQVLLGAEHYRVVAGRLELLPANPPPPQAPLWLEEDSTTAPSGLLSGAGSGRWSAILPPA